MGRHHVEQPGLWRRLIKAGLWTVLSLLGGLLAICIGIYFSLRPFG